MPASTKPNLLLLPGLLNDARLWQQQSAALAEFADITVADLTGADSIAALASAALRQAPAGPFALAGLSMGGYVAQEIVRQVPERVAALALLDTNARPDTPEATAVRHKLMELAEHDFPAVTETLLPKLLHPSHLQDASIVAIVKAMAASVGKEAFLRQQRAIIGRIDGRPFLHRIACPTLVLCGREDAITPVEVHEEMATAIPRVQVSIIDHCGHLSTLEQPQQVNAALKKWLLEATRQ